MIRTFLAVPIEAQTVLRAFFAAAVVPRSITASLDATSLTLLAGTLRLHLVR